MIHGGPGMDSGYMAADFAPLAERHRLLFYDQRGGGRSEILGDIAGHYTMARHVADLEALRRHFGLERMTLVAHSFGPAIAAAYAMEHPDRVARMVFIGPVPPRAGDLWTRYAANLESRLRADEQARLAQLEVAMVKDADPVKACRAYWAIAVKPRLSRPEMAGKITGDFCSAAGPAIRAGMGVAGPHTLRSLGAWDFRARLAAVSAPTLVLHGQEEAIPMDLVGEWTTALPNAALVEIPQASHFPYVERPDLVWPAIEEFLAGRAQATPQERFWTHLAALCGRAFDGTITANSGGSTPDPMAGRWLRMHVRDCSEREIRVPFQVGDDRSRVWVFTRTDAGLRLEHDHRHEDGKPDAITMYGGESTGEGTATEQRFPAGASTRELFARANMQAAFSNVWSISLQPGRRFQYALTRPGREFRVEFDLTKPVEPPPPPWGAK